MGLSTNFVAPCNQRRAGSRPQVKLWSSGHSGAITRKSEQLCRTPAHARGRAIHFTAIKRGVRERMKRFTQPRNQQRKIQQTPSMVLPKNGELNSGALGDPIEDERSAQRWAS